MHRVVLAALIVWGGLCSSPAGALRGDARSGHRVEASAAAEQEAVIAARATDAIRALVGPRRSGGPMCHGVGPAVTVERDARVRREALRSAAPTPIAAIAPRFAAARPCQPRAPPAST
jgi:hypothetical protein